MEMKIKTIYLKLKKIIQEIVRKFDKNYYKNNEKTTKLISKLLLYGIEVHKVDVSGYNDVGEMPKEEFLKRKETASFIGVDDYLFLQAFNK